MRLPVAVAHKQVTYSGDGVYVSLGLICNSKSSSTCAAALADSFRSAIYAFGKTSLYTAATASSSGSYGSSGGSSDGGGSYSGSSSTDTVTVNAAVYIVSKAWYRSVSVSSSVVLGDSLNNFAQPVKPQTLEDVFNGPFFVQKVRCVLCVVGAGRLCVRLNICYSTGQHKQTPAAILSPHTYTFTHQRKRHMTG